MSSQSESDSTLGLVRFRVYRCVSCQQDLFASQPAEDKEYIHKYCYWRDDALRIYDLYHLHYTSDDDAELFADLIETEAAEKEKEKETETEAAEKEKEEDLEEICPQLKTMNKQTYCEYIR